MNHLAKFLCIITLFAAAHARAQAPDFSMARDRILHDDEDLGIVNGRVTCGVSKDFVGRINGIWSPPFVSSDFSLRWTMNGSEIPLGTFVWRPDAVNGASDTGPLRVTYAMWLQPDRTIVQALRVSPVDAAEHSFDLALTARGTLDRVQRWEFARATSKTATEDTRDASGLVFKQGDDVFTVQCKELESASSGTLSHRFTLKNGEELTLFTAAALGPANDTVASTERALQEARALPDPFAPREATPPFALPALRSDNADLDALFSRSLVHLIMNRWDVPEFKLRPYYATGSVKGGCVCDYLWNFGEVWEILPMLDPAATKAHIKQFLACDMTQHFAFHPVSGEAFGPWYPVNQEKIIGLIYFYTLLTGDTAFLHEEVNGKSIADLAVDHALVRDDPTKPVALIDYGPSNSHLELRREYAYNHVMPDLNGRRYDNYTRAAAIAQWAGAPHPELLDRAAQLRDVLSRDLWDNDAKWFRFINGDGKPELRYTMQVFKLFNSPVLSADQVSGLLSHFNEREFFSQYGMHSMSKLDPAYDQVDIDNGGGGACVCFPPQIAERLYKANLPGPADDILRRITWWGQRMPYWGDSIVANDVAYRKDTPLQCTIDGATVAQCIIFGMFGIAPKDDGTVDVAPRATTLLTKATLGPLHLRGHDFYVWSDGQQFFVQENAEAKHATIGETITLPAVIRAD